MERGTEVRWTWPMAVTMLGLGALVVVLILGLVWLI